VLYWSLKLDFGEKKTFDKVEHQLMMQVMKTQRFWAKMDAMDGDDF